MSAKRVRFDAFGLILLLSLVMTVACAPEPVAWDVIVSSVPPEVDTAVEGIYREPLASPPGAYADTQNLTWLFNLVFESHEDGLLRFEQVEASFKKGETTLWKETYPRPYLERLEWIDGAFEQTTEYFMGNIGFKDGQMVDLEESVEPELRPGEPITWVRIPFARPWFAAIDRIDLEFVLEDEQGTEGNVSFSVPVVHHQQKVELRLPFEGIWVVNAGNDLTTGHRRTGLNGLTTFGWDFVKVGGDGMPYRTNGSVPQDYYTYGGRVLAAGDGVVVEVRNDIPMYGIGETPPLEILREDGDVFAGNLVIIDHGNGEYSLTCHMKMDTIPVQVGDEVKAGQFLGFAGNSGNSHYPHIHFNLMDGPQWLEAKGLPAVFNDFERIRTGAAPMLIERGNPISGWFVRR